MSAELLLLAPSNSTNALFRAWGSAFCAAQTSFGLPQTNDTGQINWSTVQAPTSPGAFVGYEMRRFNDALQATYPCFIKYEFGSSVVNASIPAIQVSVGFSTNGAGSLQIASTAPFAAQGYTNSSVVQQCPLSGNVSRVAVGMFSSLQNSAFSFTIERTHDSSGGDTGTGILIYGSTGYHPQSLTKQNITLFYGSNFVNSQEPGFFTPSNGSTAADGEILNFYPNIFFKNGTPLNPSINSLCYFTPDRVSGSITEISVYGVLRKYYAMHDHQYSNRPARGNIANTALMLLHE